MSQGREVDPRNVLLALAEADGVTWSICIRDQDATPLVEINGDVSLRTASMGKVLLLLETARQLTTGALSPDEPLTRTRDLWVGDSGVWHTLSVDTLPLADVASLVGAVSDNLATNVLLERVGLPAVAGQARALGLVATGLHDRVREVRTEEHPPTPSTGSACELSRLMSLIATGSATGSESDGLVRQWLSGNVDQSMVGSAFVEHAGLDPLAHHVSLGGDLAVWNKTGTDAGIRADVGAVSRGGRSITWAAIANWEPTLEVSREHTTIRYILRAMRDVGRIVLGSVTRS